MIVFLDSSVVLRKLFGEPHPLKEWATIRDAYVSRLFLVEAGRVFDRYRLEGKIDDVQIVQLHQDLRQLIDSMEILGMSEQILQRATGAMPTTIGTLDATHLATAMELKRLRRLHDLVFATHDGQQAQAAIASGFDVVGV